MATPIQYTPQYIPTDIGMFSDILAQKQAQYEAGYAAPQMFADKFAQIPVSQENIAGKQAILGGFQEKIQNIVDRYGGDYGAASRDIVREIARERQNPFYQLAPQHSAALKRQQSLMDKYGAFALPLKTVPQQFVSPEGQVQDVDLDPVILNQQDLERALATEFGGLGKQVRESGLRDVAGRPGMLESITTRGITKTEVPEIAEQMMERLYAMNPDLAAAIDAGDPRAQQIAQNMAEQLVGGATRQFSRDPSFNAKAQKVDPATGKNWIASVAPASEQEKAAPELKEDLSKYVEELSQYNAEVEKYKNLPQTWEELKEYKKDKGFFESKAAHDYISRKDYMEKQVDKSLKPFKGAMFDDLTTNYGMSPQEAVQVIVNEKSLKPVTHPVRVRPTAERSKEAMLNDLSINLRRMDLKSIDIYDDKGNKKTKTKESLESDMKEAIFNNDIVDVEVDLKNGNLILHDKNKTSYGIPSNALGNRESSRAIANYSKIMNVLYGDATGKLDPVVIGNNIYTASKEFNPEIGGYESVLYAIDPINQTKKRITEPDFNNAFFTEMFSTYGTEPQYKPTYIN